MEVGVRGEVTSTGVLIKSLIERPRTGKGDSSADPALIDSRSSSESTTCLSTLGYLLAGTTISHQQILIPKGDAVVGARSSRNSPVAIDRVTSGSTGSRLTGRKVQAAGLALPRHHHDRSALSPPAPTHHAQRLYSFSPDARRLGKYRSGSKPVNRCGGVSEMDCSATDDAEALCEDFGFADSELEPLSDFDPDPFARSRGGISTRPSSSVP